MAQPFSNNVLRITDFKTLQLIQEYKKEECLWNTNLMDYPNLRKRKKAADGIAEKLGIENFQGRHVLVKFKNLRNSYSQELKKVAANLKALEKGQTTELYTPRVFWFSAMDSFIRPHLRMASSIPQKIRHEGESTLEEQFDWNIDTASQEENCSEGSPESEASIDSRTSKKRKNSSSYELKDEKIEHADYPPENLHNDPLSDQQEVQQCESLPIQNEVKHSDQIQWRMRSDQLTDIDNNHDYFGKYVASLLRRLPPQRALEVQPKIISLIISQFSEQH